MSDELTTMVDAIIQAASDETLAEHVRDSGSLGLSVRKELTKRGHDVHYSNVNDVIEAGVMLHTPEQAQESVLEEVEVEEADEPSSEPEEAQEPIEGPLGASEEAEEQGYYREGEYPVDEETAFVSPQED